MFNRCVQQQIDEDNPSGPIVPMWTTRAKQNAPKFPDNLRQEEWMEYRDDIYGTRSTKVL